MLVVSGTSPKVANLLGLNITTYERRAWEGRGRNLKNGERRGTAFKRVEIELGIGIRDSDWRGKCDC